MFVRSGLLPLIAAPLLMAQSAGIPVRHSPTDYATRNVVDGITVAASVVPPDEVRKIFSKDLSHEGYIVIEVAVYPIQGTALDVTPDEFMLRVGADGTSLATQSPAAIAAGEKPKTASNSKTKVPQLPDNVHVYNTATIGVASGSGPYGRQGGVYTGTSTTVGIGDPPPYDPRTDPRNDPRYDPRYPNGYPPNDPRYPGNYLPPPSQAPPPRGARPDRTTLKQELEDKELPTGRTTEPVAGYLYFPKSSTKQKNPEHELIWYRTAGQIRLSIPSPK